MFDTVWDTLSMAALLSMGEFWEDLELQVSVPEGDFSGDPGRWEEPNKLSSFSGLTNSWLPNFWRIDDASLSFPSGLEPIECLLSVRLPFHTADFKSTETLVWSSSSSPWLVDIELFGLGEAAIFAYEIWSRGETAWAEAGSDFTDSRSLSSWGLIRISLGTSPVELRRPSLKDCLPPVRAGNDEGLRSLILFLSASIDREFTMEEDGGGVTDLWGRRLSSRTGTRGAVVGSLLCVSLAITVAPFFFFFPTTWNSSSTGLGRSRSVKI